MKFKLVEQLNNKVLNILIFESDLLSACKQFETFNINSNQILALQDHTYIYFNTTNKDAEKWYNQTTHNLIESGIEPQNIQEIFFNQAEDLSALLYLCQYKDYALIIYEEAKKYFNMDEDKLTETILNIYEKKKNKSHALGTPSKNTLADMAKFNKKHQKGQGYFVRYDAGDVEHNIEMFNMMQGNGKMPKTPFSDNASDASIFTSDGGSLLGGDIGGADTGGGSGDVCGSAGGESLSVHDAIRVLNRLDESKQLNEDESTDDSDAFKEWAKAIGKYISIINPDEGGTMRDLYNLFFSEYVCNNRKIVKDDGSYQYYTDSKHKPVYDAIISMLNRQPVDVYGEMPANNVRLASKLKTDGGKKLYDINDVDANKLYDYLYQSFSDIVTALNQDRKNNKKKKKSNAKDNTEEPPKKEDDKKDDKEEQDNPSDKPTDKPKDEDDSVDPSAMEISKSKIEQSYSDSQLKKAIRSFIKLNKTKDVTSDELYDEFYSNSICSDSTIKKLHINTMLYMVFDDENPIEGMSASQYVFGDKVRDLNEIPNKITLSQVKNQLKKWFKKYYIDQVKTYKDEELSKTDIDTRIEQSKNSVGLTKDQAQRLLADEFINGLLGASINNYTSIFGDAEKLLINSLTETAIDTLGTISRDEVIKAVVTKLNISDKDTVRNILKDVNWADPVNFGRLLKTDLTPEQAEAQKNIASKFRPDVLKWIKDISTSAYNHAKEVQQQSYKNVLYLNRNSVTALKGTKKMIGELDLLSDVVICHMAGRQYIETYIVTKGIASNKSGIKCMCLYATDKNDLTKADNKRIGGTYQFEKNEIVGKGQWFLGRAFVTDIKGNPVQPSEMLVPSSIIISNS